MSHRQNYVRATWQIQIAGQERGDGDASITSEMPKRAYNVAAFIQAQLEYMLDFGCPRDTFLVLFLLAFVSWISTGHHDPVPPMFLSPITSHMQSSTIRSFADFQRNICRVR